MDRNSKYQGKSVRFPTRPGSGGGGGREGEARQDQHGKKRGTEGSLAVAGEWRARSVVVVTVSPDGAEGEKILQRGKAARGGGTLPELRLCMRGRSKDSGQTEEAGDGPAHERREGRGGEAHRQAASEANEEAQQRQGAGGRLS